MNPAATDCWQEAPLAEIVRGDAPIGYGIVQPGPHVRGGVPVVAIRDLPKPELNRVHRSTQRIEAAYKRSRIAADDILLSIKGTTGRVGVVPTGFVGNISRDVARLRLGPTHEPGFWFQMLQSPEAQQILQQTAVGSTRQELSIGTLRMLRFRFPSRDEQARIARVFSNVDDHLEILEQQIDKKTAVKTGIMQRLLMSDYRLPGFSASWVERQTAQIASITKGTQLGRVAMEEAQSFPVWNGGVEPSGYTSSPNVRRSVVTVSEGGNSCGWVGRPDSDFWLGGHCYALDPMGQGYTVNFLYHRLKSIQPEIMGLRVGSGLPNIQKRRLAGLRLYVPTDWREADAIATILDDADAEIHSLRTRSNKARALKTGMMQEMFGVQGRPATVQRQSV